MSLVAYRLIIGWLISGA